MVEYSASKGNDGRSVYKVFIGNNGFQLVISSSYIRFDRLVNGETITDRTINI